MEEVLSVHGENTANHSDRAETNISTMIRSLKQIHYNEANLSKLTMLKHRLDKTKLHNNSSKIDVKRTHRLHLLLTMCCMM